MCLPLRYRLRMTQKKSREGSTLAKAFGRRLTALMEQKGLRLENLAGPGLKFHTLESWRFGHRFPRPRGIVDLAAALHVEPSVLIDGLEVTSQVRAEVEALKPLPKKRPR